MRFGEVTRAFIGGFRGWDLRSRVAFGLALLLLVIVLVAGSRLPEAQRTPTLIGIIGLLVMMQAIFLYANRGMVTPVTQAQRLILAARYGEACALLERAAAETPDDATVITLLGNAQRMAGRVDESRETLTKAIQTLPHGHFLQYSLARTLMASGAYASAAEHFAQALADGAPPFAAVDLAEAQYRAGEAFALGADMAFDEPHITLMAAYVRWRGGMSARPDEALIKAGRPYWEKTARRFEHTPYGTDIQRDLAHLAGDSRDT